MKNWVIYCISSGKGFSSGREEFQIFIEMFTPVNQTPFPKISWEIKEIFTPVVSRKSNRGDKFVH